MTKLSVNVNKLALLRNSREKNNPDLLWWGRKILEWGAHGLTVHPRPDERHVRRADVPKLSSLIREWNQSERRVEFNIEGYPSADFLQMAAQVRPDQCTLVPDPPEALTSNAGWKFSREKSLLTEVVQKLHEHSIRVSLFLDVNDLDAKDLEALVEIGPERVEFYTEAYADSFNTPAQEETLSEYQRVATLMKEHHIGMNAGHDLNQKNLRSLIEAIPEINEVSIGHALICEALLDGFERTVQGYLSILGKPGAL